MFQTLFRLSDVAVSTLLTFFQMFLSLIANGFNLPPLGVFASKLPKQVQKVRGILQSRRDNFVCCSTCHEIYDINECIQMQTKTCSFVRFPNHPQECYRVPCGTLLKKTVKTSGNKLKLVPHLVYCYRSIIQSLQEMILRPRFVEHCEVWRKRNVPPGMLNDVYDGEVWENFMIYEGTPFLSLPCNFALQVNIDWFQPFERTQHSEGVIYLSVMNFPREQRFLQENIILIGVIPGPKEPKSLNPHLKPVVNDLLNLWKGMSMQSLHKTLVYVQAALLCVACDVPAAC